MNFQLSHENITTALREYMDKRDIIPGKQFVFRISTGRKGNNICHAIIETLDQPQQVSKPVQQPAEAVVSVESKVTVEVVESPSEAVIVVSKEELVKQFFAQKLTGHSVSEANKVVTEEDSKAKPFKKLFSQ